MCIKAAIFTDFSLFSEQHFFVVIYAKCYGFEICVIVGTFCVNFLVYSDGAWPFEMTLSDFVE